ncbi:hypothetical protein GCM10010446_34190 [Streptomyces enissocaesilis]|uniref:Uncharacterized protein n=1 Tax=Streptomyces enissocaesilis TaxID=332589 RepID=A0ABN3XCU6_9ACTN
MERAHYATAVPSSSTIWPGIASRVTPSIVVVGATPRRGPVVKGRYLRIRPWYEADAQGAPGKREA